MSAHGPTVAIFTREAATAFRRPRTWWLTGLFVATLLALLALFWPRGDADAAERGRWLFRLLAGIELGACATVAAALAAPSVALERERETLGLLAIAGARPGAILAGKALGRLAQVGVLVATSIPLVGALFAIGGLSPREVGAVFVEALALGALGAGLGALFSVRARRAEVATLEAFAALSLLALVPDPRLSPLAWYRAAFDPLRETGEHIFRDWWVAPVAHAALGALALAAGALLLARTGSEPARGGAPAVPLKRLLLRLRKRGGPLGLESRFGTEVAALRWRERSARAFSDAALAIALVAALVAFEVLAPGASRAAWRANTATALAAVATALATVLGAATFARERDQRTIEKLAAAPVEAEQFLLGKVLGISRAVVICGAAVIVHVGVGALRPGGGGSPEVPPANVVAIAATIPFGLALHAVIGLSLSCHQPTVIRATAGALFAAVLLGAVGSVQTCFFWALSPPAFVRHALGPSSAAYTAAAWLAVAAFAALLAAAVAVVAWNHLRARFDELVGRAALDLIEIADTIPPL